MAARCFEPAGPDNPLCAHTSPVYVDVRRPAAAADDAKFFLEWIGREIGFYREVDGFRDPRHRDEMIEFFQAARRVYARMASPQQPF